MERRKTRSKCRPACPPAQKAGVVRVVIAYKGLPAALRANAVFEQISRSLGDGFAIESSFWDFDEISEPGLRERARGEFSEADMVVVSHQSPGLPSGLTRWMQEVLTSDHGKNRAVISLQAPLAPATQTPDCCGPLGLRAVASGAGADFFCERDWGAEPSEIARFN